MAVSYLIAGVSRYVAIGLSSDQKPTPGGNCCWFLEGDTGKLFHVVGGAWAEIAGQEGPPGPQGEPGPQGDPGVNGQGVLVGGTTGQVLTKTSNADFETAWQTPAAGGGPIIKAGIVSLSAGGSSNITFPTPFPPGSVVKVVALSQINNTDTSCTYSAHTITVNGFTLRGAGNPVGNVAWIATNAGNT